jgi:SAM-dependent methyltransferase
MADKLPHDSAAAWYDVAFDEDYLQRYAHRDDEEARLAARLIATTVSLRAGMPALDLCCGAGRHLPFLTQLGMDVFGGDLSMPLLRQAHSVLRADRQATPVLRLDMRHLPFRTASLELVTNFFTAFGYFEEDEENAAVIGEVARVLKPGGWFLIDFLNSHVVRRGLLSSVGWENVQVAGENWRIRRALSDDRRRAEKLQEKVLGDDVLRVIRESVRLFSAEELRAMLERFGIAPIRVAGDYTGAPFDPSTSPRLILLGRRA